MEENTPANLPIAPIENNQTPVITNSSPSSPHYKKGSFTERLLAYLIDAAIIIAIELSITIIGSKTQAKEIYDLIGGFVAIIYAIFFLGSQGATPGMKVLKLKVVSISYQNIGYGKAILRETIGKFISGIILYLGYLWILTDKRKQGWHDKIAKTFVVKLDNAGNLISANEYETVTTNQKVSFWVLLLANPLNIALLFLIVYVFLFRPFQMSGESMLPSVTNKEYMFTNLIAVHLSDLHRGDIIVFKSPVEIEKDFIKRVIGEPGDTILLKDGFTYLNGKLLDESAYLESDTRTYGGSFLKDGEPVVVPEGEYFVMGDNRPFSSDSREWGFLKKEDIIGKYMFCYWNCPKK